MHTQDTPIAVPKHDPNHSDFINALAAHIETDIAQMAASPMLTPGLAHSAKRLRNVALDHREWVGRELSNARTLPSGYPDTGRRNLINSAIECALLAIGWDAAARAVENGGSAHGTTLRDELAVMGISEFTDVLEQMCAMDAE